MEYEKVNFVYNEPALMISDGKDEYLVVGDLHIGMERKLSDKGVHVFVATEIMAKRIKSIMKEFGLKKLILLGDIKESILHPDTVDIKLIKSFFDQLKEFEIKIVAGNHDAYLSGVTGLDTVRELRINGFSLLHGDKLPDKEAMQSSYIITAHAHPAIATKDMNGIIHGQKVWLVAGLSKRNAKKEYGKCNQDIKLVVMPAFNDFITGYDINNRDKKNISPLFRREIFSYRSAVAYSLSSEPVKVDGKKTR